MLRRSIKTIIRYPIFIRKARNFSSQLSPTNFSAKSNSQIFFNLNYYFARRLYSTSELPAHTRITLPALSPTMEKGTLAKWEKKEGDSITEGDLLAEIETDKATVGLEASEEGYVAKILIPSGTKDIPLGKLLCIVVPDKKDIDAFKNFTDEGDSPSTPAAPKLPSLDDDETIHPESVEPAPKIPVKPDQPIPPPSSTSTTTTTHHAQKPIGSPFGHSQPTFQPTGATPYAKNLAAQKGILLTDIQGSGPQGVITGQDIVGARMSDSKDRKPSHSTSPVGSKRVGESSYTDIALSNMRQTIARRLLFSKQSIPHYYLTMEIDMTRIEKVRKEFNKLLAEDGIKLSVNDFIIKGSAHACLRHKECNSSWMETHIREFDNVDVSIAVSTPTGLITPIIFGANSKGLRAINAEAKELAGRAREGKLQPAEFQGGTFTVSNLGMFGIDEFTAIINPPQACILSIGRVSQKLTPDEGSDMGFKTVPVMKVTLGCDHRLVDGAVGAQWLKYFKNIMEDPIHFLL